MDAPARLRHHFGSDYRGFGKDRRCEQGRKA